jgi:hypothetical protein
MNLKLRLLCPSTQWWWLVISISFVVVLIKITRTLIGLGFGFSMTLLLEWTWVKLGARVLGLLGLINKQTRFGVCSTGFWFLLVGREDFP